MGEFSDNIRKQFRNKGKQATREVEVLNNEPGSQSTPHLHPHENTIEKKFRLQDFFNQHWNAYCQNPAKPIKEIHYRAVNAIRACRTERLGKIVYACPECGDTSEVYFSCKHRFCPTCSWGDTLKWGDTVYEKLLNIPHRHAVATLPHELNPLLESNSRLLNSALFRASAETIKDWMGAKGKLSPGIISVLHTAGEKKNRHHHVHSIVSMGGIHKKDKTLQTLALLFIPYEFLAKKFRIKFEDILIAHFDNGELEHNFQDRREFMLFIKSINKQSWRFHFEPPMENALAVIRYIGRYSKRACLSEHKITAMEGEYISFRYKDNMDRDTQGKPKEKVLPLHYRDFFPLLLQHVPEKGFQQIRYYGVYANSSKLSHELTEKPPAPKEACTAYKDPKKCEYCGIAKEPIYFIQDTRPAKDRRERFNIKKHKHVILPYEKIAI